MQIDVTGAMHRGTDQKTNMEPPKKKQKTRSEQAREREQRRLKAREDAISSMDKDKDVHVTNQKVVAYVMYKHL